MKVLIPAPTSYLQSDDELQKLENEMSPIKVFKRCKSGDFTKQNNHAPLFHGIRVTFLICYQFMVHM